jgi:hypothetical protein
MDYSYKNGTITFSANANIDWNESDIIVSIAKTGAKKTYGSTHNTVIKIFGNIVKTINVKNANGIFCIGEIAGCTTSFSENNNPTLVKLIEIISNKVSNEISKNDLCPLRRPHVSREINFNKDGIPYPTSLNIGLKFTDKTEFCLVSLYDVTEIPLKLMLSENPVETRINKAIMACDKSNPFRPANFLKTTYGIVETEKRLTEKDLASLKNKFMPLSSDNNFAEIQLIRKSYFICEIIFSIMPYFTKSNEGFVTLCAQTLFCKKRVSAMEEINDVTNNALAEYEKL